MNEKDLNKLKALMEDARLLEILIAEIEGEVTEKQNSRLNLELFCIGNVSTAPIADVVSSIDNALHHPDEYPEPDSETTYIGAAESVYEALSKIKDKWKITFQGKKVNNSHAYLLFNQWMDQVYKYTEYISQKYDLPFSEIKTSNKGATYSGCCWPKEAYIKYNRNLIKAPAATMRVVIHELCHIKFSGHGKDFWQLYEDICISEGVLLNRILGDNESFDAIKGPKPYRWKDELSCFTTKEDRVIEKYMYRTKSYCRSIASKQ